MSPLSPNGTPFRRALRSRVLTALFLGVVVGAFAPGAASAIRICSYNLLNYDNQNTVRDPAFRTVLSNIPALDVLAVQEIQDQTAVNNFKNNVLDVIEPGQWAAAQFFNDPSQSFNQGLFYRISTIDVVSADTLGNAPRDIAYYTVRPDGTSGPESEITIFVTHFKAGSSSSDQSTRLAEAERLRLFMNTQYAAGTNLMVCGDFNMRSSTESAYQEMIQSQADNDGRMFDPINMPGNWNNNFNFRFIHTQSTRTGTLSPGDGGATGGMDDRFDFLLTSAGLTDAVGLDEIPGTYSAYGQDGNHFNLSIADSPTIPEGQTVADALERASDHLPVFMEFELVTTNNPPVMAVSPLSLDFGTVIVGAPTVDLTVTVENQGVSPADDLNYSFTGIPGFSVPGGGFTDAEGGGGNLHTITMLSSLSGVKDGNVLVSGDDPANPTDTIAVAGTVLDHAVPSLDGLVQVLSDTLDFGTWEEGSFSDTTLLVHNLGYTSLQALLNVYNVNLIGGGGRFSIVGGFTPSDVGGAPEVYTLHFDDVGATAASGDTTYGGFLVFSTRDDQALAGAIDLPSLTVRLLATVAAPASNPPVMAVSPLTLDFGTVVVGATADLSVTVENQAASPAADLNYSFTGTAGFTVPGGGFVDPQGGGGNLHTISMDTGAAGNPGGNVLVSGDDPANPTDTVAVSGVVLDHAVPSLDGVVQTLSDTLDFGAWEEGFFSDTTLAVHNLGYSSLQALLNVYDAAITGGAGRFSIVGGFSPSNVGGTAQVYTLDFDDVGATSGSGDTTYTASLVFSTRDDQALPGAIDLSDLTVTLSATVVANTSGVGDDRAGVVTTLLLGNRPNPFAGATRISYQLAEAGPVRLSVFDVRGRLVTTLVDGWQGPGDHDRTWSGLSDSGRRTSPGIYFYVLETDEGRFTRRMTRLR